MMVIHDAMIGVKVVFILHAAVKKGLRDDQRVRKKAKQG